MTRKESYPESSFNSFPYYFSETPTGTPSGGIRFGALPSVPTAPTPYVSPWFLTYDLGIYYDSLDSPDVVECWASRWDVQNYSVIIETWVKKSEMQSLRNNMTPGAVGELYTILGRPRYYDSTWQKNNTIKLKPHPSSQLSKMRNECLIFPKNVTEHIIDGDQEWVGLKIEGLISGQGAL